MNGSDTHDGAATTELTILDLAIGQGDAGARARLHEAIDRDPLALLDLADAVALVQQFRCLETTSSAAFHVGLQGVVQRAERHQEVRYPSPSRRRLRSVVGPLVALVSAAAVYVLLAWWDPLHHVARRHGADLARLDAIAAAPADAAADPSTDVAAEAPTAPTAEREPPLDGRALAWQDDVERMRQRLHFEPKPHLREALEAGLGGRRDELRGWLDPRNALMMMRLDHELRANASLRREALRRQGGLADADERVQRLAAAIAEQLHEGMQDGDAALADVALALRALVAAGPGDPNRAGALTAGGDWVAARLPAANEADLVAGLAALVEVAAVTGQHRQLVVRQGQRLVDCVLHVDSENWSRRLPELLSVRTPAGILAEASRVLTRLPGFGVDAGRCAIVRQLLLGPLRERRAGGEDSPALLAAMVYGSADLLGGPERLALEVQLRRWQPRHLLPDFATLQQLAWSLPPRHAGHLRQQAELRQLAVCADPGELGARAAFCLVLATGYAAFTGDVLPRLAAGGFAAD